MLLPDSFALPSSWIRLLLLFLGVFTKYERQLLASSCSSVCLSACLSVCLSVCLCVLPSIPLFVHPFVIFMEHMGSHWMDSHEI